MTPRTITSLLAALAVVVSSCVADAVESDRAGPDVPSRTESVPRSASLSPLPVNPEIADAGVLSEPFSLRLSLGQFPIDAASDGDRWWVLTTTEAPESGGPPAPEASLVALDPTNGNIEATVELAGSPSIVAADGEAVWVAHWGTGAVTRVDPETGEIVAIVHLELPFDVGTGPDHRRFIPNDLAIGHGSVWVSTARGALARIDVTSNAVSNLIELTPPHPQALAVGPAHVWVAEDVHGLTRIATDQHDVATLPADVLNHAAQHVAVIDEDVYVAGHRPGGADFVVSRVDAQTMEVLGSATFDEPIVFLGWVNGSFGTVDADGTFWYLGARPRLIGGASRTNWDDANDLVQLGREAWMIDDRGAQLVLLGEIGFEPIALPFAVSEGFERRPVPINLEVSPDWIPLDRGPLDRRWPGVVLDG